MPRRASRHRNASRPIRIDWEQDTERRRAAGAPEDVGHREKWRLALDMRDELAGWGLTPALVAADAGYGQNADFRAAVADRGIPFVVGVRADLAVQPHDAQPTTPAWPGNGRRPQPRYRQPGVSVGELAAQAGPSQFAEVTWREGSSGPMTSRFLAVRVRLAGRRSRQLAKAAATAGQQQWDGVLPDVWLLAEGPDGESCNAVVVRQPPLGFRRPRPPVTPARHRRACPGLTSCA